MIFILIFLLQYDSRGYTTVNTEVVRDAAINETNDQLIPAEAQCIALLGQCARHDTTDDISNCATIKCHRLPSLPWSPANGAFQRLDGTYCGPGKTCQSGKCLATQSPLPVVHGAWGDWTEATSFSGDCRDDGCAEVCRAAGQRRVRIQYRQCNKPFANNGGKQCSSSSNIRAVACDETACRQSDEKSNHSSIDLTKCLRYSNHTDDWVRYVNCEECMLLCPIGSTEVLTNAVNGMPCMDGNGICVQGCCADVKCSDEKTFAFAPNDCPDYDSLAGQQQPLDAQCQGFFGDCASLIPNKEESPCGSFMCRITFSSKQLNRRQLDGTFCGPNRLCLDGRCTETQITMNAQNGSWSEWSQTASKSCGGSEDACTASCEFRQVRRVMLQDRVCNNPYPNNGGTQCSGGNVRAKSCEEQPCQTGANVTEEFSHYQSTGNECLFLCDKKAAQMPNGVPCKKDNYHGICINNMCATVLCDDKLTYAFYVEDCPTVVPETKSFISKHLYLILAIIFAPTVLTALLLCFVTIIKRRKRSRLPGPLSNSRSGHSGNIAVTKMDPFEITYNKLHLFGSEIIGKGAFSVVYKGRLSGNAPTAALSQSLNSWMYRDCDVAVKTLLIPSSTEPDALWREIAIMKKLGFHAHIIAFLGCVTITNPICIAMELGEENLLSHVRNLKKLVEQKSENLSVKQLISFCWQVSDGLCFLKTKKLVHRDLAARNVILVSGLQAKVADFGLCLVSPDDEPIFMSEVKRVPIRWLAIECLTRGEFSYASDVWSFGVFMFEIFSLGEIPYNDNSADALTALDEYLEKGGRLPQPSYASDKIYEAMLSCWLANTQERISCTALCEQLSRLLDESAPDYGYVSAVDSRYLSYLPAFHDLGRF